MSKTLTGTFAEVGKSLQTEKETWTYDGHSNWYHTWQLVAILKSIDKTNMTATVSLKGTLWTQYVTWQYTQKSFGIYANGAIVKELHLEMFCMGQLEKKKSFIQFLVMLHYHITAMELYLQFLQEKSLVKQEVMLQKIQHIQLMLLFLLLLKHQLLLYQALL